MEWGCVYAWLTLPTSISQNSHTGGVGCRPHITRQYSNNSMVVTYTCEQFVNFVHRMQVHGQLYQLLCSSTGYRGLLLKDSMPWCKPIGSKLLMGRIQKTRADSEVYICMYKQILVTGLVFLFFLLQGRWYEWQMQYYSFYWACHNHSSQSKETWWGPQVENIGEVLEESRSQMVHWRLYQKRQNPLSLFF